MVEQPGTKFTENVVVFFPLRLDAAGVDWAPVGGLFSCLDRLVAQDGSSGGSLGFFGSLALSGLFHGFLWGRFFLSCLGFAQNIPG